MKWKRFATVMALAVAALVVSVGQADAAYTYSTALTITGVTGPGSGGTITNTVGVGATYLSPSGTAVGLQDILTPGTFLPTTPLSANLGNVGVATTSAAPDTFTVNYTDVVTLINPAPGGSSLSVTISGSMIFAGIQAVGGAFGGRVDNQYNPPFTGGPVIIGPNTFSLNIGTGALDDFFGPPTIGSTLGTTPSGSIGGVFTPAAVPEPSSVAMLGLGLLGIGGLSLRRRLRNV